MQKLADGEPGAAADLFEDPDWRAVAKFRAENYAESAADFARGNDARSLYNLGNAMAYQGKLDAAIDAYEKTLELDPDDEDAKYNLELVKDLKKQQEQDQQSEGDDQQSTENPGGEGEQSDSDAEQDQQGQEGESQADGEPQEGDSENTGEEMSEEDMRALQEELQRAAEEAEAGEKPQQLSEAELAELREQQEQEQAMEQWLRRIPDDPGGLLRRKFRYQYQRSGVDQDGNNVWPDNEVQPW